MKYEIPQKGSCPDGLATLRRMVVATPFERKTRESTEEAFQVYNDNNNKAWTNIASKSSEVDVTKSLFHLIPCNSRLRYCVDVGSRNGEDFVDDTLITHSLLVSNDQESPNQRQGHESFVDNDHKLGQNTWFGVLLQPDESAFRSLRRLHEPLGNLCLQFSPSIEEGGFHGHSLECILRQHVSELPIDFDFLGLYEAGYSNYWLLRKFLVNSAYRPKVVCISYDNRRPADVAYIPDRTNAHELPSKTALTELMSYYDYQLVTTTARCCFFSTRELYQVFLRNRMPQPGEEIPSISPATSSKFIHRQHSPKEMKEMMKKMALSIHSPTGMNEQRSGSLGMKWLLQRRNMHDSGDSTAFFPNHETPSEWKTRTNSMSMKNEMDTEAKLKETTKDVELRKTSGTNQMMAAWRSQTSVAGDDMLESRDDFAILSPRTTLKSEREGTSADDFDDGRETESENIVDVIRSTKGTKPQQFTPDPIGDSKHVVVPPDPVGDTILQKIRQTQGSNNGISLAKKKIQDESKIRDQDTEDKIGAQTLQETPNDKYREAFNDSILELKNAIFTLTQEIKEEEDDIISEGFGAKEMDDEQLTGIEPLDLSAICGPRGQSNERERSECVKSLVSELQRNGYALIRGTSVSRFVCSDAIHASHILLSEADESVRTSCQSQSPVQRGYTPKCTERSSSAGLTDMVRKFRVGSTKGEMANIWPLGGMLDEETDEYIRNSFLDYHDKLFRVAVSIAKCVYETTTKNGRNSQITKPSPVSEHDPNTSLLTVINCEHGSRHETLKPLIASHRDPSLVTIFLIDGGDCANIQHESSEGIWESTRLPRVLPLDPIFVVYAGESLEKLSGGLIPSKARRIFPSSGDQVLNGLSFSLMPSDGRIYPSRDEEPAGFQPEVLPNSISKLASELKDIDEMFRSCVFTEDVDDFYESDFENYLDEDFEYMMDPFHAYDHEDSRDLRRSHLNSHRYGPRPSRASDPLRREKVGVSTRRGKKSSRRATIGGMEFKDHEEWILHRRNEIDQRNHDDRPTQLLGSSKLPIVLETQNSTTPKEIIKIDDTKPEEEIIKIDENFKPMPVVQIEKNVEQPRSKMINRKPDERVDSTIFLPVASAWNPPNQESNKPRKSPRQARSSSPKNLRNSSDQGTKKVESTKSRILYDVNYKGRKFGEANTQSRGLSKNDAFSPRSEQTEKVKKGSPRIRRKETPKDLLALLEENSIQSSDASAVLDEILGDRETKSSIEQKIGRARLLEQKLGRLRLDTKPRPILKTSKVAGSPSQNCDPIFQTCRQHVSTQQAIFKTCDEVQQQSLPHPPSATNMKALTKKNTLHNQQSGQIKPKKSLVGNKKSDEYVPFRGSVVEWKMRENARRIKSTSLLWEQRGYKFGVENGKKGKK